MKTGLTGYAEKKVSETSYLSKVIPQVETTPGKYIARGIVKLPYRNLPTETEVQSSILY
ncbi:MAG: hypothetical protein GXO98_02900 [Nitrospirae bacterium]|nr:hypothetical protein [Nitrospirota bacterium]